MRLNERHEDPKIELPRTLLLTVIVTMLATGCSIKPVKGGLFKPGSNNAETSSAEWLDSFEEAMQMSASSGKPVLANFTGSDWCVWCQRLDEEVFAHPKFADWASENVVLLKLDYPVRLGRQSEKLKSQNAELKDRYGVDSYPTVLLIDASGNELGRTGYVKGGPDEWIPAVQSILSRAVQP
jgi:protein disulfide-isomerase